MKSAGALLFRHYALLSVHDVDAGGQLLSRRQLLPAEGIYARARSGRLVGTDTADTEGCDVVDFLHGHDRDSVVVFNDVGDAGDGLLAVTRGSLRQCIRRTQPAQ